MQTISFFFTIFGMLFYRLFLGGFLLAGISDKEFSYLREKMVLEQIKGRGIKDPRVLQAFYKVPRERFVPEDQKPYAYDDTPLPIGYGQTISQPYVVAYMTEKVRPKKEDRALEIGTGSGYQAAILAELVKEVYTIEIIPPLCERAKKTLQDLGYKNIWVYCKDGYEGLPDKAPFDIIILTAAPPKEVPPPLIKQLAKGGRLIAPVGKFFQELILIEKDSQGKIHKKSLIPVRFVPMKGKVEKEKR